VNLDAISFLNIPTWITTILNYFFDFKVQFLKELFNDWKNIVGVSVFSLIVAYVVLGFLLAWSKFLIWTIICVMPMGFISLAGWLISVIY